MPVDGSDGGGNRSPPIIACLLAGPGKGVGHRQRRGSGGGNITGVVDDACLDGRCPEIQSEIHLGALHTHQSQRGYHSGRPVAT
ncbi:hypothetical protein roselon_00726 [Roseibacterium elongatum DSM 19469]|uniref:Uncharacterized protein n=1 Tax=Roseicyclus elongatus DSM 19469 TaxID=1294273 RepID=W8S319_9RHOB|nr:hypothetical protein roselon_00726 [Roseibacterium elongatum DSM 19469]